MKTGKKIFLLFISLIVFLAACCTAFILRVFPQGMDENFVTSVIYAVNPLKDKITIEAESIDKGIFNTVKLNNVSISNIDGPEIVEIGSIKVSKGILELAKGLSEEGNQDLELELENVSINYEGINLKFQNADIDVSLENGTLGSINAQFDKLNGQYLPFDLSFDLQNPTISYNSDKDIFVESNTTVIGYKEYNAEFLDILAFADVTQVGFQTSGFSSNLLEQYFSDLGFSDFVFRLEVGETYKVQLSSLIKGKCYEELIGEFETELFFKDEFKPSEISELLDFANKSSLVLNLNQTKIESLQDPVSLVLFDDFGSILLSLKNGNDISLSSSVNLDSLDFSLDLSLLDFKPFDYEKYFYSFVPNAKQYFDRQTLISGDFGVAGIFKGEQPEFRLNVNSNIDGLLFNNQKQSFTFVFDGFAKNKIITANKALIDYQGFVIDLTGWVNTQTLIPDLMISLSQKEDETDLFCLNVGFDNLINCYEYSAFSPKYNYGTMKGNLSINNSGLIHSESVFDTQYQTVPFEIDLDIPNQKVEISHPKAHFFGSLNNSVLEGELSLIDSKVEIAKDFVVRLSGTYKGYFDFKTGLYHGNVDDSRIYISDFANLGFDLDVRNNNTVLTEVVLGLKDKQIEYDGSVSITYVSIRDFVFNTERLNFDGYLKEKDSNDYIQASLVDKSYSLNLDYNFGNEHLIVDLLGTRGIGFYANSSINNVNFDAHYINQKLDLYNGNGKIGSFDLNDFNFAIDFLKRTLEGSFGLENIANNHEGDVKRGALIDVGAQLDSISVSNLSVSGIEAKAEFDIEVKDAFIGEEFPLKDNKFNLRLSDKKITVNGELVDGFFDFKDMSFALDVDKDLLFGFKSKGFFDKNKNLDVSLSDIYFPIKMINQFINWPFFQAKEGYLTGDLLVKGNIENPSFYGMLYAKTFDMELFWIPFQTLSLKSVSVFLSDHDIKVMPVSLVGHSSDDGRFFNAKYSVDMNMENWKVNYLSMKLGINDSPMDFWLPIKSNGNQINFRGDVTGDMEFNMVDGVFKVNADLFAENSEMSFEFPEFTPDWYYDFNVLCDADMNITTGKNVEFYYPDKDDYFLNFTTEEGNNVNLQYDSAKNEASANGKFTFKNGEIYYIQNTFKITDGSISLGNRAFATDTLDLSLNLRAKLREYDAKGKPNDIYLVLNNSNLDEIVPTFESSSGLSENEIIQLLGQSVVGVNGQRVTASSVASFAAAATDTVRRLGLIQLNSDYSKSLTSSIRDSLKLDVFSIRSQILENIVVEALPGFNHNVSLLSRYLNGTSIFAGKYLPGNTFARVSALLRSVNGPSNSVKFLTDDLVLDLEFSLDWENPIAEFSVFVQPTELSVINFLDNIGFSFTKTFKF